MNESQTTRKREAVYKTTLWQDSPPKPAIHSAKVRLPQYPETFYCTKIFTQNVQKLTPVVHPNISLVNARIRGVECLRFCEESTWPKSAIHRPMRQNPEKLTPQVQPKNT